MGEFRKNISEFLPLSVLQALVIKDRKQLLHRQEYRYAAFVDMSGGRSDDAALAIAHREKQRIVLDVLKR